MIEGGEATDESDVVSELQEAFKDVDLTTDKVLSKMEQKHELTADYVLRFVADGACLGGGPNVRARSKCPARTAIFSRHRPIRVHVRVAPT